MIFKIALFFNLHLITGSTFVMNNFASDRNSFEHICDGCFLFFKVGRERQTVVFKQCLNFQIFRLHKKKSLPIEMQTNSAHIEYQFCNFRHLWVHHFLALWKSEMVKLVLLTSILSCRCLRSVIIWTWGNLTDHLFRIHFLGLDLVGRWVRPRLVEGKVFGEEKKGFVILTCRWKLSKLEFMRRTWEESICCRKTLDATWT
jgi:hypothetical protein